MSKQLAGLIRSLLALSLAAAGPIPAHHSAAGYDMAKTLSASATLKEFRWGAPHSAVVLIITGADGKLREVQLASASPSALARQGFKPRDFKVGDKMEITWHPAKTGALGGTLSTIKLPDGRKFDDLEFAPGLGGQTNQVQRNDAGLPQTPEGAK